MSTAVQTTKPLQELVVRALSFPVLLVLTLLNCDLVCCGGLDPSHGCRPSQSVAALLASPGSAPLAAQDRGHEVLVVNEN